MTGSTIDIKTDSGVMKGYLAVPAAGRGPGVVVIQEIFGINAGIRAIADGLAGQGFTALAPDLFWRIEPGIEITDKTDAEWQRAFQLYQAFDVARGVSDLKATITTLRTHKASTGKVGTVGFCLGGLLAYLCATQTDADASIGYYGVGIEGRLSEAMAIKKPLMLHIAEEDKFVSKEAQGQIKAALGANRLVTIHSYPGQDHAFARVDGQHTDKAAADLAGSRSLAFFKQHLG